MQTIYGMYRKVKNRCRDEMSSNNFLSLILMSQKKTIIRLYCILRASYRYQIYRQNVLQVLRLIIITIKTGYERIRTAGYSYIIQRCCKCFEKYIHFEYLDLKRLRFMSTFVDKTLLLCTYLLLCLLELNTKRKNVISTGDLQSARILLSLFLEITQKSVGQSLNFNLYRLCKRKICTHNIKSGLP